MTTPDVRDDLSPYLVHLTREFEGQSARDNLLSILSSYTIKARTVHGSARNLANAGVDQTRLRTVCMSEAPLQHLAALSADLPWRGIPLTPYGVVLLHDGVVRQGGNRVWYINQDSRSVGDWLTKDVQDLIDVALHGYACRLSGEQVLAVPIERSAIARITPFFDWIIPGRKEFSWEREWRVVGDVHLDYLTLTAVVVPADDHEAFAADLVDAYHSTGFAHHQLPVIAPEWDLERIESAMKVTS